MKQISGTTFEFQVSSSVNGKISIFVDTRRVRSKTPGATFVNDAPTAHFDVQFFAFSPSVRLELTGFPGQTTSKEANMAILIFNSTTEFDGRKFIEQSLVSMKPALQIINFQYVDPLKYSFIFSITKDNSAGAKNMTCVPGDMVIPAPDFVKFACAPCVRPEVCMSQAVTPPSFTPSVEFPLSVVLQPVPELGMGEVTLPFVYDTLWAQVELEAPEYAKGQFDIKVTWSEPMENLLGTKPTFSSRALIQNSRVLDPRTYVMTVVPTDTGVLEVFVNGSAYSKDLARNSNEIHRTGARRVVVFSAGPPKQGTLAFTYDRPLTAVEYTDPTAVVPATPTSGSPSGPALVVSYAGFETAVDYKLWVTWSGNGSWPIEDNITGSPLRLQGFQALLGVEYTVYMRASNNFGDETTVSASFLHPAVRLLADGVNRILPIPGGMLSKVSSVVSMQVTVEPETFMALNPLKVLEFSTANLAAGDQDPCIFNSPLSRCTYTNLRIEVPNAKFVVFRKPVRLQLTYGPDGWTDNYFMPKLRYYETFREEWRDAAGSCPKESYHEHWDAAKRVYTVAFCHLTQFAVFETFVAASVLPTQPPPPRPGSHVNPIFFGVLGAVAFLAVIMCCAWYLLLVRPARRKKRAVAFRDLGIRPVSDRAPRLNKFPPEPPGRPAVLSIVPQPDLEQQDEDPSVQQLEDAPQELAALPPLPELGQAGVGMAPPPPPGTFADVVQGISQLPVFAADHALGDLPPPPPRDGQPQTGTLAAPLLSSPPSGLPPPPAPDASDSAPTGSPQANPRYHEEMAPGMPMVPH